MSVDSGLALPPEVSWPSASEKGSCFKNNDVRGKQPTMKRNGIAGTSRKNTGATSLCGLATRPRNLIKSSSPSTTNNTWKNWPGCLYGSAWEKIRALRQALHFFWGAGQCHPSNSVTFTKVSWYEDVKNGDKRSCV